MSDRGDELLTRLGIEIEPIGSPEPPLGISCPYPGLRSFTSEESVIFFGREKQEDALISRLKDNRFLAVTGTSGCGKSSLVRAGLLGRLRQGDLGLPWHQLVPVEMQPENRPLLNLAAALVQEPLFREVYPEREPALTASSPRGADPKANPIAGAVQESLLDATARMRSILRDSNLGLRRVLEGVPKLNGRTILLLVDQFEELFTETDPREAYEFINLLVDSLDAYPDLCVVITMRSDFLGACAAYPGLAQKLNSGQFLVPAMTHDQCEEAIAKPAKRMGAYIEPELVNRLQNDSLIEQDQLPVLQHALMRMWIMAGGPPPDSKLPAPMGIRLTRELYDGPSGIGTLDRALSLHATAIYEGLEDLPTGSSGVTPQMIAEKAFRRLTGAGHKDQDTRRHVPVQELAAMAGATLPETIAVLDRFRTPSGKFLRPLLGDLDEKSSVNIIHESVIRKWDLLRQWVREESRDADFYRRLAFQARDQLAGRASYFQEPDMICAEQWMFRDDYFRNWAHRYRISEEEFDAITGKEVGFEKEIQTNLSFLRASLAAIKRAKDEATKRLENDVLKRLNRRRWIMLACSLVLCSLLGAGDGLLYGQSRAEQSHANLVATEYNRKLTQYDAALVERYAALTKAEVNLAKVQNDLKKASLSATNWKQRDTKDAAKATQYLAQYKHASYLIGGFEHLLDQAKAAATKSQGRASGLQAALDKEKSAHTSDLASAANQKKIYDNLVLQDNADKAQIDKLGGQFNDASVQGGKYKTQADQAGRDRDSAKADLASAKLALTSQEQVASLTEDAVNRLGNDFSFALARAVESQSPSGRYSLSSDLLALPRFSIPQAGMQTDLSYLSPFGWSQQTWFLDSKTGGKVSLADGPALTAAAFSSKEDYMACAYSGDVSTNPSTRHAVGETYHLTNLQVFKLPPPAGNSIVSGSGKALRFVPDAAGARGSSISPRVSNWRPVVSFSVPGYATRITFAKSGQAAVVLTSRDDVILLDIRTGFSYSLHGVGALAIHTAEDGSPIVAVGFLDSGGSTIFALHSDGTRSTWTKAEIAKALSSSKSSR